MTGVGLEAVDPADVLLLYASQTGNAKLIAEDIREKCESEGVSCCLRCCSQLQQHLNNLHQVTCLILVAATTGDGDPPDTARKFNQHLHKKDQPRDALSHLSYTVLGLGDTNYNNFCNFGKTIDKRLHSLGAHRFYDCGWADDGTGLEVVIEPWMEGLFPALKKFLIQKKGSFISQDSTMEDASKTDLSNYSCKEKVTNDVTTIGNNEMFIHASENNLETNKSSLKVIDESVTDHVCIAPEDNDSTQRTLAIAGKYNIDILSQEEIQCLPIKLCSFPLDKKLTLPAQSPPYLTLECVDNSEGRTIQVNSPLPSAASQVVETHVVSVRRLTSADAVKTALEVTLRLPKDQDRFAYEPGDSFGIIVKNKENEVEILLNLLGISDRADKIYELSVLPNTKKKAAAVPKFIPVKSSLRYILEHCVDIRSVPKKPLVRALLEYTSSPSEKRRLQELVSKEGASEYTKNIREANLTLLDLLIIFGSCKPPVTTLLEHLPRLQPRAYSIISSPLVDSENISFVFNVVEIPKENTVTYARKGICTGWLFSVYNELASNGTDLNTTFSGLTISEKCNVCATIYLRSNQNFHLPKDLATPIIMIGPGTGVAPFVGFLRHRQKIMASNPNDIIGKSWLFFGCRHKEHDFLYKEEIERFQDEGILNHFIVSFSRETTACNGVKYVQDNILKHGAALASLLVNEGAVVYVCGDAHNMAKDVFEAFVSILQANCNQTENSARNLLAQMQIEKRYLQDVWT
ncbi:methionine synthase reductase-like [Cherax quadricarinatus]